MAKTAEGTAPKPAAANGKATAAGSEVAEQGDPRQRSASASAQPRESTAAAPPRASGVSTPRASGASTPRAAATRPSRDAERSTTGTKPKTRLRQPPQPAGTPASASKSRQTPRRPTATTGVDIVGTAVQAAAELAEIGLTLSARALRNAVSRLPRP